jgi:hypothetical protein
MLVERVTSSSVGLMCDHRFWISLVLLFVIYNVGNADALAITMVYLLAAQNRWPAVGQVGRQFVEVESNWRASVPNYASIYASLAAQS